MLYISRKMSVNLTPQKSAVSPAIVGKTDTLRSKELAIVGKTFDQDQVALALAVGMGAAAEVARQAGHVDAARCIAVYRDNWEAKVRPSRPRAMVRGDICPPEAARYATAEDFGL